MQLLVATDHRFIRTAGAISDTYCFDRAFFDDYLEVFDSVVVAARVRTTDPPASARRSDGGGVVFLPLPDFRGAKWLLGAPVYLRRMLATAVGDADAVCLRIPSVAGRSCFALAQRLGRPAMFELIGDPVAALSGPQHGLLARFAGLLEGHAVRRIVRGCVAGSYVSLRHLQERYPHTRDTVCRSISSIRLLATEILPPRRYQNAPEPLRLVLVASLVPVKCHDVLLRAVAHARALGASVCLDLVGDGPLRPQLAHLADVLEIRSAVTFHGHISGREQLHAIIDRADLFVMTSDSEGMPRAMIEAMARGLPAIGTTAGGIAEILPLASRVQIGDHHALGALLVRLKSSPTTLEAMALHSNETAQCFLQDELSRRRREVLRALRAAAAPRSS